MPIFLFNDDKVEIACPRCGCTSPRNAAWVHANDRYNCPACNTEITLDQDKQLAELGEPNAIRPMTTGSSGGS